MRRRTNELTRSNESLSAARKTWLPIDTAPRDGSQVLVWAGDEMHLAFYVPERSVWMQKDGEFVLISDRSPTHWMRLPAPPRTVKTTVRSCDP
jgi:hypothetical protein